jgi:hypothetical protein
MPHTSCESPLNNYIVSAKDKYNSLSMALSLVDRRSSIVQIQLVGKTIEQMIPVVIEGIDATLLEMKNEKTYDTDVRYVFNDNNQMVYASTSFVGLRPRDLHERTARLNPDLYNPEELKLDLITEVAFQAGATRVISVYYRAGDDNRNINIYELDPKTKIISLTVANTATDGNYHSYSQINQIAQASFEGLNVVNPTDTVFLLTDAVVPQETVLRIVTKVNPPGVSVTLPRVKIIAGDTFNFNTAIIFQPRLPIHNLLFKQLSADREQVVTNTQKGLHEEEIHDTRNIETSQQIAPDMRQGSDVVKKTTRRNTEGTNSSLTDPRA